MPVSRDPTYSLLQTSLRPPPWRTTIADGFTTATTPPHRRRRYLRPHYNLLTIPPTADLLPREDRNPRPHATYYLLTIPHPSATIKPIANPRTIPPPLLETSAAIATYILQSPTTGLHTAPPHLHSDILQSLSRTIS